jgi:outer membrane protein assembly factor BamB
MNLIRPVQRIRRLLFTSLSLASLASAADWAQWRGPHRNGVSDEKGWSSSWGAAGPRVLWKANVGLGFASFTVADGRVSTTGNAGNTDTVFCFDAVTGKQIWKQSYPADLGDKYYEGGTSGTPAADGGRLYQLSRWGDVFCYEASSGKIIWEKNVQKESGANIPDWGFGGSPLVHEGLLILNVGGAGMALDKTTGRTMWQSGPESAGYSTPLPLPLPPSRGRAGDFEVIMGSAASYLSVNPKTGAKLWEVDWRTRYGVNAAEPVAGGNHLFISSGYNKGCALLKIDGGTRDFVWQNKELKNQLGSSVLLDGHLYGFDGDNTASRSPLKCLDFATGAVKWAENTIGPGALMAAGGKLIVLTGKGELIIAKPSPAKFELINRAQILKGKCWTAPVLANGRIYCRNSSGDIVCLDVRGGKS